MPVEVFMPFKNSKYGEGLTLQEYAGSFWLIASKQLQDGRIVHDWCHPSRNKQPLEKSLPWKIKLGEPVEEAFDTLAFFGRTLKPKT